MIYEKEKKHEERNMNYGDTRFLHDNHDMVRGLEFGGVMMTAAVHPSPQRALASGSKQPEAWRATPFLEQ